MTIGLTGPPGVGKSTLTAALVAHAAALAARRVGVISVDPSSPFSHGALLGDRIRLTEHFVDPGVFIRSMASRGHLGGVAGATADAVTLMDAFGFDVILIETVGVGQSEIEIAEIADTILRRAAARLGRHRADCSRPGSSKIADVFVVNKRDHPMALQLQREIRSMMEMLEHAAGYRSWSRRKRSKGAGIDELWAAIVEHEAYLRASGTLARKRRSGVRASRARAGARRARASRRAAPSPSCPTARDPYAAAHRVPARASVSDGRTAMFFAAFFGLVSAVAIYHLLLYAVLRARDFLSYGLYLDGLGVFQFARTPELARARRRESIKACCIGRASRRWRFAAIGCSARSSTLPALQPRLHRAFLRAYRGRRRCRSDPAACAARPPETTWSS